MKSRLSLLLFLLPLLAACGPSDNPAAAPAATPSAMPAIAAPGPAANSETPATAPIPGTDYFELPQGAPYAPLDGQVEVAEVFGYVCVHCANFEPSLVAWKKTLPAGVRFSPVPAAFGGPWDTYARAFYAAEALGIREQSHQALFDALHVQHSLAPTSTLQQIGAFYAQYGVDAQRFVATMQDAAVSAKVAAARQFAERSRVEGTPSLIIDGKYLVPVDERGYDHMLRTAGALVAQRQAVQK
jgi:thiol:disulfide interchange protein DsbA